MHPEALKGSLLAYMARYNITPIFCKSETTGYIVTEILKRELKEKLERGEYDDRDLHLPLPEDDGVGVV